MNFDATDHSYLGGLAAALCLLIFALGLSGCEVPLTDDGQYLACTPSLECRNGYECRLVENKHACVPTDSAVGASLDAGGMDAEEDVEEDIEEDTEPGDTQGDTNDADTTDSSDDASACPDGCPDDLLCDEESGSCVECIDNEHCAEGICSENACVECTAEGGCTEEQTCVIPTDEPASAQCMTGGSFLEWVQEASQVSACEAAFSTECTPTEFIRFHAGLAPDLQSCLNHDPDHFVADNYFYQRLDEAWNSGQTQFNGEAAAECMQAVGENLGADSCRTMYDKIPQVCFSVLRPPADRSGQECINMFNCPDGEVCKYTNDTCGTCSDDTVQSGQPCNSPSDCDISKGLICGSEGTCVEWYSKTSNESCFEQEECAVGYTCYFGSSGSSCTPVEAKQEREPCDYELEVCEGGTACSGDPSICKEVLPIDGDCSDGAECALGLFCNFDTGKCKEHVSPGGPCDISVNGDQCGPGHFCDTPDNENMGTCTPYDEGSNCTL
ncbi:MAG: hypothetical protein ACQEVA_17610 [Myxococcota bacterium]